MNSRRIRTLVVDDSALVRKAITDSLARDPEIEVVGTAIDPYVARDKILALDPDVITLDIEMPRMDGITFLKKLMKHRPMPVIIMSSLTQAGSGKALEALQAGAVDVVAKPSGSFSVYEDGIHLAQKIKAAAQAKISRSTEPGSTGSRPLSSTADRRSTTSASRRFNPRSLILLGASTGGTEALKEIFLALPSDLPPICVVQHIPAQFSLAFANRLNEISRVRVHEARDDDRLEPGRALIAPGGQHLAVRWIGHGYTAHLNTGPLVHYQRPSVDVLFDSAAKCGASPTVLAAELTGMGADGAAGLLHLRQAGASTIAQDEASSVVFGMPREAIRMGAAAQVLPLNAIADAIDRWATAVAI